MDSRSNSSNSSATHLGGENPVFAFDAPPVTDKLQGDKNHDSKNDPQERWDVGITVSGETLDGEKKEGKIISIQNSKDDEMESVTIQASDEEKYKLKPDSLKQLSKKDKKIKGFNEWIEQTDISQLI